MKASMLIMSRSSLSHDFYQVMIGSESMSLPGWKQLAKWSLDHSCMDSEQMKAVTAEWTKKVGRSSANGSSMNMDP